MGDGLVEIRRRARRYDEECEIAGCEQGNRAAMDRRDLLAEVGRLRAENPPYPTVVDSIGMLDALGSLDGAYGNTLYAMTKAACEELARLRAFRDAATAILRRTDSARARAALALLDDNATKEG